ncbi:shikimate dehydrogenase [bacterium]|nr:shikimate dehydrogenase [bacterium]MCK4326335.1 shikimate dehydrogenase [bacterium]MCK4436617.1 shikimate dehydrogenase [bacterium]
MKVEGGTKIVGVFGYPVKHSASPAMHNAAFKALGLDYIYLPFEVRPERLGEAVRGLTALNISGVNVTIPHKEAACSYLDEISKEAKLMGAVNTIIVKSERIIGYNTDGQGFITSLKEDGREEVRSKNLVILGGGGAGRAVATQAALEGAKRISIMDKIVERAEKLSSDIRRNIPSCQVEAVFEDEIKFRLKEAHFLINATPVGMKLNDPILIDPDWLQPKLLVFDLVYNLGETKLMKAARERGCRAVGGLGMLVHQGAISFKLWTGKEAPVKVMRKVLEEQFQKQ